MFYLALLTSLLSLCAYLILVLRLSKMNGVVYVHASYFLLYFVVSPFLHVYYKYLPSDLYFFDFEDSFTVLAFVNSLGLLASACGFLLASRAGFRYAYYVSISKPISNMLKKNILIYLFFATLYFLYMLQAGNVFYIESKKDELANANILSYMILESVPILLSWYFCLHAQESKKPKFYIYFLIVLLASMFFAGLRGSRVAVLFSVFSFLILYVYMVRPISFKSILILVFLGLVFNTVYSNYKYAGVAGVINYLETGEKSSYIQKKDSEVLHFVLGDLTRSSVQAKIVDSINSSRYTPPYTGSTYLSALFLLVPSDFRPASLESKRDLGTRAQYGFTSNSFYSSSRIYGLFGEGMLNFGYASLFFTFIGFGVVHFISLKVILLFKKGPLVLFVPYMLALPIYILFYDLDNIIFQSVKFWGIPVVIYFYSKVIAVGWRDRVSL